MTSLFIGKSSSAPANQKGLYKNRISCYIPPYLSEWKQQQIGKCITGIWMIMDKEMHDMANNKNIGKLKYIHNNFIVEITGTHQ